jgi:hypothetical protein
MLVSVRGGGGQNGGGDEKRTRKQEGKDGEVVRL